MLDYTEGGQRISSRGVNSGKILFYQLTTKLKTFLYYKINRKISNLQIQKRSKLPLTPHAQADSHVK